VNNVFYIEIEISVSDEYKKLVIESQISFIQNFHIKKIFIHMFIRNCEFLKIFIYKYFMIMILRVFIFIQITC